MKIRTVIGANIKLGRYGGYYLAYVMPCGRDWIAEIKIMDVGRPRTPNRARVYVSENPGVATLMNLAHERGQLDIK
jgi:hypothetical protein